ncbi:MAG: protein-L-isoaspartate(D-aspartate) O-methyltransferase [Candidatus Omnitrophota bacterium]|nr:protein-L-isoaspartate(D-aspartate) O-methyltransferase [Candidatus Omnitrophota bacterium]
MKTLVFTSFLMFGLSSVVRAVEDDPYASRRDAMVESQIRARGVSDPAVLEAMRKVKRHVFVAPAARDFAYEDYPLSIGHGQTISQPFIVAYMTEVLKLTKQDKVLEIGTGSGYQAAVLAEIVAEVYTIEIVKELAEQSSRRFQQMGYRNIHVKSGDGFQGWKEHAPYDAIIVTAAPSEIPEELVNQLKVGGRMVIPVGTVTQELYLITKTERGGREEKLIPVRFVPMVEGE